MALVFLAVFVAVAALYFVGKAMGTSPTAKCQSAVQARVDTLSHRGVKVDSEMGTFVINSTKACNGLSESQLVSVAQNITTP